LVTLDIYVGNLIFDITVGKQSTIIFHVFVLFQIFGLFNARKVKLLELNIFNGLLKDRYFCCSLITLVLAQFMLVEFGGQHFNTVPLSFKDHLLCACIGFSILPVGLIAKLVLSASRPKLWLPNFTESDNH
jgi:P-type Ca2+ transporter type 2C